MHQLSSTVLLLLLLLKISTNVACPSNETIALLCTCQDSHNGITLDCSGRPSGKTLAILKENQVQLGLIQELKLKYTDLNRLDGRFFEGLYVKKLDLSHNSISVVDEAAFRGLESVLQTLEITHNNITSLPSRALNGMIALLKLDLSNNSIGNLENRLAFKNVPKLYDVNLANNEICEVQKATFDEIKHSVQTLNLGRNCLRSIPASAIRGFRQLVALHLHDNRIETIKPLAFMNLPFLNLINLANNRIRSIHRQAFLNVPNLRLIYLSDNRINRLAPNQFRHFPMLEMIDLTRNMIETIPNDAFSHMHQLKQLYLGENLLTEIDTEAFTNSTIVILFMPFNEFTELKPEMFNGLEHLQQLNLKDNQIVSIDQSTFHNMPSLIMIDLSDNLLIDLPPATFIAQFNMFLVDLSGNKLLRTPYGAFNRRVMTVVLQENPLVCTEQVHMLQQGIGVYIPETIDRICADDSDSTSMTVNNNPLDRKQVKDDKIVNSQSFIQAPSKEASTIPSIIRPGTTTKYHRNFPLPPTDPQRSQVEIPIVPQIGPNPVHSSSFPQQPHPIQFIPEGAALKEEQIWIPKGSGIPSTIRTDEDEHDVSAFFAPNEQFPLVFDSSTPSPTLTIENNQALNKLLPKLPDSWQNQQLVNFNSENAEFELKPPTTMPSIKEKYTPKTIIPFPVSFLSQGPIIHKAFAVTTPATVATLPPEIVFARAPWMPGGDSPEWQKITIGNVVSRGNPSTNVDQNRESTIDNPKSVVNMTPKNSLVGALGETIDYDSNFRNERGPTGATTTMIIMCLAAVVSVMIGVFVILCVVRHRSIDRRGFSSSSGASSAAARTSAYVAAQAARMNFVAGANNGTSTQHVPRPTSTLGRNSIANGQHTWIYTPGSYTSASNYYK